MVYDRELPDGMFELRRGVAWHEGRGFALWLTQPSLGRFVVGIEADTTGERWINAMDEDELIVVICKQLMAAVERGQAAGEEITFTIDCKLTPQSRAKIDRLVLEVNELAADSVACRDRD
jgi:hypothetical protein